MTTTEKLNYKDITNEWINNRKNYKSVKDATYFEHDGIKYYVDGKRVVLDYSEKEKEVALWLVNTFGGEIYMLPRINKPDGIMTADYLFKNEYWDLKSINGSGKRVIEDAIKMKKRQSNNFILDITNSKIQRDVLFRQLNKIYYSKTTNWVDKIIVKNKNNVIAIYKNKKTSRNPTGHD